MPTFEDMIALNSTPEERRRSSPIPLSTFCDAHGNWASERQCMDRLTGKIRGVDYRTGTLPKEKRG